MKRPFLTDEQSHRILNALKALVKLDDTLILSSKEMPDGQIDPEDENRPWLEALQEAQAAIEDVTGERVPNDVGVLLLKAT